MAGTPNHKYSIVRGIDANGDLQTLSLDYRLDPEDAKKLGTEKGWSEISLQVFDDATLLNKKSKITDSASAAPKPPIKFV